MSSRDESPRKDGAERVREAAAGGESFVFSSRPQGSPGVAISHIYIEEGAQGYPDTRRLLSLFPDAVRIPVADYKEVFNRPNQRFQLQKRSNKLILAVKKENFLYRGSERINSFGDRRLYYNSLIRNCLYNCDYCFLQGMHPSAYLVVFVNGEDFFAATDRRLEQGPLYLSISYLTDLLGFEGLIPFCRRWIEFAHRRPELTVEIRTKSDNFRAIRDLEPAENVVLSWTMSPEGVAASYERGTASFKNRLFAARAAADAGWRLRICFDPLLKVKGWRRMYAECVSELFKRVPSSSIEGFSVGVLRMSSSYLKEMRSGGQRSELLYGGLRVEEGLATYPPDEAVEMQEFVADEIGQFADRSRVSFVGG